MRSPLSAIHTLASLANETVPWNLLFIRGIRVSVRCVICNHICPPPSRAYIRSTAMVGETGFIWLVVLLRRDQRKKILFHFFGLFEIRNAQRSNGRPYMVEAEKYSNLRRDKNANPWLSPADFSALAFIVSYYPLSREKGTQATDLQSHIFCASVFRYFFEEDFRGNAKRITWRSLHLRSDTVLSYPLAVASKIFSRSKTSHSTQRFHVEQFCVADHSISPEFISTTPSTRFTFKMVIISRRRQANESIFSSNGVKL